MRTLARFEYALGRRVSWGFRAHQLKVVPHAFEEMNAFYSPRGRGAVVRLLPRPTTAWRSLCLSHDIVVHETTHALLDGLRSRFMAPSSPDQAAFHEAFADIVALLSVFSLGEVRRALLERDARATKRHAAPGPDRHGAASTMDGLMDSVLLGLADEMGAEAGSARVSALRRSVEIEPDRAILDRLEFGEPHRRGEILVAAMMRAFVDAWTARLEPLGTVEGDYLDLGRVAEEGATIADVLLTMAIRAIDYTPPIHIDVRRLPQRARHRRQRDPHRRRRYGLRHEPARSGSAATGSCRPRGPRTGAWVPPDRQLGREGVHFGSLQTDPIEMFRLAVGQPRGASRLDPSAYTRVASVRPCVRTSPDDGLPLRETVAECIQYVKIYARRARPATG